MAQTSTTIEDIYRGVVHDVINHVREAFLDENVDIDVLLQLKQSWESKIRASGAVDMGGPRSLGPPPMDGNVVVGGCQPKKVVPQLDGGPGMTDSSSSDEEEEEDDQLRRLQNLEDIKGDEGDVVEEEPLNSGDDQSDDEDLETLFDAENIVVCQFEKVHRARNKWKFTLKDGIMRIDGKEYCFQKCTGEAEW